MSNRTATKTLDEIEIASRPDLEELEVTLSYYWENDGIGPYEYWGAYGVDKGTDYVVIEDYDYDKEGMTPEEIENINSMIDKKLNTWSAQIQEDAADEGADYDVDNYDYDYEDRY